MYKAMKIKIFIERCLAILLFGLLISSVYALPKDTGVPSQENANWEVFTDRSYVLDIIISEDEKTLWVGTSGGLEQRDSATGELVRVFTNVDGLPSNSISVLSIDSSGGLWIGTNEGLAYRSASGDWTVYNERNSGLPSNYIEALSIDSSGGLWIGTSDSLTYRSRGGDWTVYNTDNSLFSSVFPNISTLSIDLNGGLWIGTIGPGWGGENPLYLWSKS